MLFRQSSSAFGRPPATALEPHAQSFFPLVPEPAPPVPLTPIVAPAADGAYAASAAAPINPTRPPPNTSLIPWDPKRVPRASARVR